jgi:hypothetical protein
MNAHCLINVMSPIPICLYTIWHKSSINGPLGIAYVHSTLGLAYAKGIGPWIFNDHNKCFGGWKHGEVHGLTMQSLLEVTNPQFKHKRDHKKILHIFQLDMRMCHEEEKNEKRMMATLFVYWCLYMLRRVYMESIRPWLLRIITMSLVKSVTCPCSRFTCGQFWIQSILIL